MARYSSKSWRAYRPGANLAEPAALPRRATVALLRPPAAAALRGDRCRILGLDPGSQRTGYGIIDCIGADYRHVAHGCIDLMGEVMTLRLRRIHAAVTALVREFAPNEAAIERVFVNRNVQSALKLGQARGAALAALPESLPVGEYAPRAVKLATVGFGGAAKQQVAHMVQRLLEMKDPVAADPADALGVAICHAQARRMAQLTGQTAGSERAR